MFFSISLLVLEDTKTLERRKSLEETHHYLGKLAAPLQLISPFIKNETDTGNFLTACGAL